jgi:PAS domain S-box-containing protein
VSVLGPMRHRTKHGPPIDVRVESTRVSFAGRPCLLCTVIDETDRRRLEARLHETDRLWRSLVESSPDIVVVVDIEGTVHFVNRARPPFAGRRIVGAKIWEFATEGSEPRMRALLGKLAETRQAARYEAPGIRAADGTMPWYEVCAIPLALDGPVDRVLWIATDVTLRRTAVEKLGFQAALLSQVSQPVVADGAMPPSRRGSARSSREARSR